MARTSKPNAYLRVNTSGVSFDKPKTTMKVPVIVTGNTKVIEQSDSPRQPHDDEKEHVEIIVNGEHHWVSKFNIEMIDTFGPVSPPMPQPPRKSPGSIDDGTRIFKGTYFVVICPSEADDDGDASSMVSVAAVREYLSEAVIIDVDTEEHDNDVGFASLDLYHETLTEMSPAEAGLYVGH